MLKFFDHLYRYRALLLMLLPGVIVFIVNCYLPIFGVIIAFKNVDYSKGILGSPWTGLDNFQFLFATSDAWRITRNTLAYNLVFIICDVFFAVAVAMLLSEIKQKLASKVYQTMIILPNFLSMVVVGYIVYALLNPTLGVVDRALVSLHGKDAAIDWYSNTKYWPFILPLVHWWKSLGYKSVIYLAAIAGIDTEFYEAARIDGANKWQQALYITLPQLTPTMVILFLLALGNIFRADFGLFYQVTMNSSALYEVTDVIDTYVYRALTSMNNVGMSSAASFYQSVVGFALVVGANLLVRRIDKEQALF